ncbi:hypothetical protein [Mycoplasma tauri]|uniref:hypothetical protein n=1 Tax=Mycoplasma tauri TaxID=547987 RepID=UPI001CBF4969|nr:hypothetical protein [Mycoplasma tauri]MBZ4226767.1 hypothetical protein [Mycoplasma tauri]
MKKINKVILSLSASATLPLVFVSSSCGDSKTAGDKKKDDVEALDDSLIKSGEEALSDIDSKLKLNYHYLSGFKNDISSLLDTYKKRSTNDNKNILQQKINYYNSKKEEFGKFYNEKIYSLKQNITNIEGVNTVIKNNKKLADFFTLFGFLNESYSRIINNQISELEKLTNLEQVSEKWNNFIVSIIKDVSSLVENNGKLMQDLTDRWNNFNSNYKLVETMKEGKKVSIPSSKFESYKYTKKGEESQQIVWPKYQKPVSEAVNTFNEEIKKSLGIIDLLEFFNGDEFKQIETKLKNYNELASLVSRVNYFENSDSKKYPFISKAAEFKKMSDANKKALDFFASVSDLDQDLTNFNKELSEAYETYKNAKEIGNKQNVEYSNLNLELEKIMYLYSKYDDLVKTINRHLQFFNTDKNTYAEAIKELEKISTEMKSYLDDLTKWEDFSKIDEFKDKIAQWEESIKTAEDNSQKGISVKSISELSNTYNAYFEKDIENQDVNVLFDPSTNTFPLVEEYKDQFKEEQIQKLKTKLPELEKALTKKYSDEDEAKKSIYPLLEEINNIIVDKLIELMQSEWPEYAQKVNKENFEAFIKSKNYKNGIIKSVTDANFLNYKIGTWKWDIVNLKGSKIVKFLKDFNRIVALGRSQKEQQKSVFSSRPISGYFKNSHDYKLIKSENKTTGMDIEFYFVDMSRRPSLNSEYSQSLHGTKKIANGETNQSTEEYKNIKLSVNIN